MFMTSSFAFWIEPRLGRAEVRKLPYSHRHRHFHAGPIQNGYHRAAWIVRPKIEDSAAIRASFELVAHEAAVNPFGFRCAAVAEIIS
jgi:hypothetical protein